MEQDIIANGVTVHYVRKGKGMPMILMHGWGCNNATLSVFEKVGSEQHEVFNLDLPGFGKSQEPPTVWSVDDYVEMLNDFCKKLDIQRPILLGHSFGGRVAIGYASRYPVDRLILVDSAGIKPRRSLNYYFKVYSYKLARRALPYLVGQKRAERIIDNMRANRGSADYRNSSPRMREVMVRCVNFDQRKQLSAIQVPTLLLWGENDTATPMRDAHIMNRKIKDSTLVSFPGAGHYSFIDNPFQSTAVVKRFIQTNDMTEAPDAGKEL